jgi:hypothetical protein
LVHRPQDDTHLLSVSSNWCKKSLFLSSFWGDGSKEYGSPKTLRLQTFLDITIMMSQLCCIHHSERRVFSSSNHSAPDLSRRHHLLTFPQKLMCGWENIWRKVVHIDHLNNVSSNFFQNMFSCLADDCQNIHDGFAGDEWVKIKVNLQNYWKSDSTKIT